MAKGWIKLHRQIQDNKIWNEKPFDLAHAWIDMIFMANIEGKEMKLRHLYNSMHVERGSFFTSYRNLAKRWGWSVNKVKRYLTYLAAQEMVTLSGTPSGTLVTLINYGVYQDVRYTDEHSNEYSNEHSNEYTDGSRLKNKYKNKYKNSKEVKNKGRQTSDDIKAVFEKMESEGKL